MIFDPTMSKKKKKKKKPFMLDEEGDTQTEETQPLETKELEPEPTEDKDVEADEEDSRKKGAVLQTHACARSFHPVGVVHGLSEPGQLARSPGPTHSRPCRLVIGL